VPYLFDSYALIAYFVEGRSSFRKYFENNDEKFTSILSLMETYSRIFHGINPSKAEDTLEAIITYFTVLPLNDIEVIREAGQFRSEMLKKKKALSYTACINYVLSKKQGHILLTGDEDFRNLNNIEFVK